MSDSEKSYRVLARKYRPDNFEEVVGQDALIRTLRNAINSGRIHHAYMLTGIRGTGKTTTARLIARALNYTGPDGSAGPTTGPTDDCETCQAIAAGRHPDVMEMDAASRTGVDDIREITDGVRYAPTSARYKVYIIDEVHMLSKQAFNALLKTLEEPPPHVIFIFATTEIRKVPVTVLSRCQRFDLRRVDAATLAEYYGTIAEKEEIKAEPDALALIARAADGSVRDGLSLLDQAIALAGETITLQQVQDMLGLSDRGRVLDVLEYVLKGDCKAALDGLAELYRSGGDPAVLIQDMLDFTHLLTRAKAVPDTEANDVGLSPDMRARLKDLTEQLSMPTLGRAWQILLKGLGEVNIASNPQAAAEMVIIRLTYAADLPDPAALLRKIKNSGSGGSGGGSASGGGAGSGSENRSEPAAASASAPSPQEKISEPVAQQAAPVPANTQPKPEKNTRIESLDDLGKALNQHGYYLLAGEVFQTMRLIKLEPGRIDYSLSTAGRPEMKSELGKALEKIAGERWVLNVVEQGGAPSMAEEKKALAEAKLAAAQADPVVAKVLELFPGTEISLIATEEAEETEEPEFEQSLNLPAEAAIMTDNQTVTIH